MRKYTVIATSGWQDDHWRYVKQFDKGGDALLYASEIKSDSARSKTYIAAVIGDVQIDGYDFVGDTRRVNVREKHLRSRQCYIKADHPFNPHTHGGRRKGAGRKLIYEQEMVKVTITLPPAHITTLRDLGEGNVSLGTRRLVELHTSDLTKS